MLFPEEDAPQLKAWIVKRIENTSDADSDVLADYVIALLRHDGDPASVRKLCEEEIPDFLTEEPKAFLDDVFQAITYRSYLPNARPPPKSAPATAPTLPPPFESGPLSSGLAYPPTSRKRGYQDLDAPDNQDATFRAPKQARRGGRRGRGGHVAPSFDPNNPLEAMLHFQQVMGGVPYPMPGMGRGRRERCPDFEAKGFCARGSTCVYDHGEGGFQMPMMWPQGDVEYDPNDPAPVWNPQQIDPFAFLPLSARGRGGRRRGRAGKRGGGRASFSADGPVHDRTKSTIVVENIPEESFSEDAVREFFSQFGNIQEVSMQPYKHLAIVKFDQWGAANAAYRSPKVIFDNRFVKVFWLKDDEAGMPSSKSANGHHGPGFNGHAEPGDPDAEPEIDMEDFQKRQEEAQKQHQERETKKAEIEQKRQDLEKQQQQLLERHREETERLQAKLAEKSGGDTTTGPSGADMLRAKLALLEQEAKILGIDPDAADDASVFTTSSRGAYRGRGSFRGRGYVPTRRGGFRGHDGRHAAYAQYSLDNRPRKLAVSGVDFTEPDKDEKLRHYLLNLGEFDSVTTGATTTHVSFPSRKAAEKFYYSLHGKELPGVNGKLDLAWVSGPVPAQAPAVGKQEAAGDGEEEEGEVVEREDDGPVGMEYELADDEAWGEID